MVTSGWANGIFIRRGLGLISLLLSSWGKLPLHTLRIFLVYQIMWHIWLAWNDQTFDLTKKRIFDPHLVISETLTHLSAVLTASQSGRKHRRLSGTRALLT